MIEKRGYSISFSLERFLDDAGKGHFEPYQMTPEEEAERREAKRLLKALRKNRWIVWGYDGPGLLPRETEVWVSDE